LVKPARSRQLTSTGLLNRRSAEWLLLNFYGINMLVLNPDFREFIELFDSTSNSYSTMKDLRRKELLKQFRVSELERFEQSCPMPLRTCQALFDFLVQNQARLDTSFHFSELFANLEGYDSDEVTIWLVDCGASNDQEVLAEVKVRFEIEVRRLSR
jgi:hypothetical protein